MKIKIKTWRITVATMCGVWISAALFTVSSPLWKYLCHYSMILRGTPYYKPLFIFCICDYLKFPICDRVLFHEDRATSCVKLLLYIWGDENSSNEPLQNTAKIVLGLTVVFLVTCVPCHALLTHIISTANTHISASTRTIIILLMNNKISYKLLVSTCLLLINLILVSVP